jgi:predicted DsbA family dithiol-disulfide isomerase
MVEFADSLSWTYVMGGLAREYTNTQPLVGEWLDATDEGGMPLDPRLWTEGPISSTYPACMAVKAAAEQASDGGYAYLRALREGLFCFRRKLDTSEALVEEARRVGLDVERFRIDLGSHAIVEAFGADLELTRTIPDDARAAGGVTSGQGVERLTFPTMVFEGENGSLHPVYGVQPYDVYRAAAEAAGATAVGEPPAVLDAIRRFGRLATREVEEICGLATPPAGVQLWQLAADWRLRPVRVLTGYLWESA